MKKIFLGVIMAIGMTSAFAADEDLMVDGKLIRVTGVSVGDPDHVLHASDTVYILTSAGGVLSQDKLPNAERIIRASLIAHSVKVVDKVEDASKAIVFDMGGAATLVAANNKAEHSNLPGTGKVLSSAGAIAAGAANGGIYAVIGYLAGGLIETDEKTYLGAMIMDKPTMKERGLFTKTLVVNPTVDSVSSYSSNSVAVSYRLEKEKAAPEDAILKMMIEKWAKQFVVVDATPNTTSSVPVAQK